MKDFLFEFDLFIHSFCFRYTILKLEENETVKYAAGVAIIFEDEQFHMLQGNIFEELNEAKVYLQGSFSSRKEQEIRFMNELLLI